MNGKEYLDQIAVKGKVKSGIIFTPTLIKLIAAGAVALIAIISVGVVISNANAKVTQTYERVYMRIHNLSGSNYNNPFTKYKDKIRDSNLRSYSDTLFSVLTTTDTSLGGVVSAVGVKTDKISKEVSNAESANINNITNQLLDASYAGNIDRVYATNVVYQVSTLIQYENEALKKSNNQSFTNVVNQSKTDLTQLKEQFQDWVDTH